MSMDALGLRARVCMHMGYLLDSVSFKSENEGGHLLRWAHMYNLYSTVHTCTSQFQSHP